MFTTTVIVMLAAALLPATTVTAQDAPECPDTEGLEVPGAEFFQVNCLDDLTTYTNTRTDTTTFGWGGAGTRDSGSIHSTHTNFPEEAVPGIQIEGWFPDSCSRYETEHNSFMPSCEGNFRRNGQFVIRVPNNWDGEHLVVGGTPGIRTQFSSDIILSDYALYKGWAYASQDKGNTGLNFFRAGDDETGGSPATWEPTVAMAQWTDFMRLTPIAAQGVLEQLHGTEASLTYAAGISNGGYQTRLAIERHPDLYDGGVDWEGTILTPEGPHIYTYVPPLLQAFPEYRSSGSEEQYAKLVHEGRVPPDSEPVWDHHWSIYWGSVASAYRPVIDPEYTNYIASPRLIVPPGDPDAEYDYHARPQFVKDRVAELSVTGEIHGKPLITLHGTLDALLPISTHGDVYSRMVRDQGHDDSYRYYVVEGGEHVDPSADENPDVMRPILPCFWESLDALDDWVVNGTPAPPSGFIGFPEDKAVEERANTCDLPTQVERVWGQSRVDTSIAASRSTFGITETVVFATAGKFPDALAAAPLAAKVGGPVLLVGAEVTDALRRELERLGALEAIVVGGPGAVSDDVVAQLEGAGLEVRRIAGRDRFQTAARIAREVGVDDGEAFVTTGVNFPDALSVAPVAAAAGAPIVLTSAGSLPAASRSVIDDLGVDRTFVVGGPNAVAPRVVDSLPNPRRLAGPERYATSVAVARFAVERGHTLDEVYVATGRNFPDALSAGPVAVAGEWGAVPHGIVLLVDGKNPRGGTASLDFLRARRATIERALLFGGTGAIADEVRGAIGRALR